jgi:hypothetical protein
MEEQLLELVEYYPAGALHHALRQTGGAGAVHDIEGMVEGELGEVKGNGLLIDKVLPEQGGGDCRQVGPVLHIGHDDHRFQVRDFLGDGGYLFQAVDGLALKAVPGSALTFRRKRLRLLSTIRCDDGVHRGCDI